MGTAPLRIGIVGAGGIFRARHAPGFRKIEDCRLVAVCNRSVESSRRAAREFDIAEIETDWRKLVARPDINAVVIGTWPYLHARVTLAALAAGKHVLCESRMASDAAEARAMLSAAKRARRRGLVTVLCPPPHGLRGDYLVKELLAAGLLGKPYQLFIRQLGAACLDPQTPLHWRQQRKYQGLNALTLGILNEVVQRWFGDTKCVLACSRVFVARRLLAGGPARTGRVDRPDAISIVAGMGNGLLATYLFSAVALHPGPNVLEAWGSDGMLRYDLDSDRIFAARRGEPGPREIPIPEGKAREWQVESDFAAAIREGQPVSPTFEDGVKYMEFVEAVERSAATGRAVRLRA